MRVYIMRGIPGSGKSMWAKEYKRQCETDGKERVKIVSADHYHMVDGVYRYNPKNKDEAHRKCLRDFTGCLTSWYYGTDLTESVIVDNTGLEIQSIAAYYRLAEAYGATPLIMNVLCPLEVAMKRGVHNVPSLSMFNMYKLFMTIQLPPHWNQSVVAYDHETNYGG